VNGNEKFVVPLSGGWLEIKKPLVSMRYYTGGEPCQLLKEPRQSERMNP
jgi:hypothetical protein